MPNVILVRNTYPDAESLYRVIRYAFRGPFRGGYAINPEHAYSQMMFVKKAFYKTEGVQLKHFVITFSDDEMGILDFEDILKIGFQTGQLFREYQMVYGIHLDTDHVHLHCVMNTVSFLDGYKYSDGLTMFYRLCELLKLLFPQYPVHLFQTEHFDYGNPYTSEKKGQYQMLN